MRLLFVHGRMQGGQDAAKLSGEWCKALAIGISATGLALPNHVKIDFPFYGDRLDEFTAQFDVAVDEVATKKGIGGNDEFADFVNEIAQEAKDAKHITDAAVRADMIAKHGPQATAKGPQNWEWVQSILSLLDARASEATQKRFFSFFLKDVFLYTRRKLVQTAIDEIVFDKLTDEPTVVVAHSLGSVISYNVLSAARKKSVRAFITIGSPLGIRGISKTLETPLRNVSDVHGWFNAYDRRDVVALNPLNSAFFDVQPAIVNDDTLTNTSDNHHGVVSYLDKAIVAENVLRGLL